MTIYKASIIKVSIHTDTESPIFGENSTHISIEDNGAGAYLQLTQCHDDTENGVVTFNDLEYLELVFTTAKQLMGEIQND